MSSDAAITIIGSSILILLLGGYLAQKYLPPPPPKIVGIDLGTTYSSIGVYHAVSGRVDIIEIEDGHRSIPSIVSFRENETLVGYQALMRAEHNPANTIYDTKRFIGKKFLPDELAKEGKIYPFKLKEENGFVRFIVGTKYNETSLAPEYVSSQILLKLLKAAEKNLSIPIRKVVMSVPAEFDELQRNFTKKAAELAGVEVLRIINEPTAAALAYGLHKKEGVDYIIVIDLGGGTLDVSLLKVQGGMFLTQAMAGNNRLGGQDFNQRLFDYLHGLITLQFNTVLTDPEDLQMLRLETEKVKLSLTNQDSTIIKLPLHSIQKGKYPVIFTEAISRSKFEEVNSDHFKNIFKPVQKVLEAVNLKSSDIDEVILVGGSTRIPKIRTLMKNFFQKDPNVAIDPQLAVTYGVAIQAGILGGMWPLHVSALEIPSLVKKIQI